MQDTLLLIAGCIVILVPCTWAGWHSAKELRSRLESGTAVDRTLGSVYKEDAPGMFWMQIASLAVLVAFCVLIDVWFVGIVVSQVAGAL